MSSVIIKKDLSVCVVVMKRVAFSAVFNLGKC